MINHIGTNPKNGFAPWTWIGRRFLLGSHFFLCFSKQYYFSNVYRLLRITLNELSWLIKFKPIITITTSYMLIAYISEGVKHEYKILQQLCRAKNSWGAGKHVPDIDRNCPILSSVMEE